MSTPAPLPPCVARTLELYIATASRLTEEIASHRRVSPSVVLQSPYALHDDVQRSFDEGVSALCTPFPPHRDGGKGSRRHLSPLRDVTPKRRIEASDEARETSSMFTAAPHKAANIPAAASLIVSDMFQELRAKRIHSSIPVRFEKLDKYGECFLDRHQQAFVRLWVTPMGEPSIPTVANKSPAAHVGRACGRLFQNLFNIVSCFKFSAMFPENFGVPWCVSLVFKGVYITVTSLPPLGTQSQSPLSHNSSAVVASFFAQLSCVSLIDEHPNILILPGLDGRLYLIPNTRWSIVPCEEDDDTSSSMNSATAISSKAPVKLQNNNRKKTSTEHSYTTLRFEGLFVDEMHRRDDLLHSSSSMNKPETVLGSTSTETSTTKRRRCDPSLERACCQFVNALDKRFFPSIEATDMTFSPLWGPPLQNTGGDSIINFIQTCGLRVRNLGLIRDAISKRWATESVENQRQRSSSKPKSYMGGEDTAENDEVMRMKKCSFLLECVDRHIWGRTLKSQLLKQIQTFELQTWSSIVLESSDSSSSGGWAAFYSALGEDQRVLSQQQLLWEALNDELSVLSKKSTVIEKLSPVVAGKFFSGNFYWECCANFLNQVTPTAMDPSFLPKNVGFVLAHSSHRLGIVIDPTTRKALQFVEEPIVLHHNVRSSPIKTFGVALESFLKTAQCAFCERQIDRDEDVPLAVMCLSLVLHSVKSSITDTEILCYTLPTFQKWLLNTITKMLSTKVVPHSPLTTLLVLPILSRLQSSIDCSLISNTPPRPSLSATSAPLDQLLAREWSFLNRIRSELPENLLLSVNGNFHSELLVSAATPSLFPGTVSSHLWCSRLFSLLTSPHFNFIIHEGTRRLSSPLQKIEAKTSEGFLSHHHHGSHALYRHLLHPIPPTGRIGIAKHTLPPLKKTQNVLSLWATSIVCSVFNSAFCNTFSADPEHGSNAMKEDREQRPSACNSLLHQTPCVDEKRMGRRAAMSVMATFLNPIQATKFLHEVLWIVLEQSMDPNEFVIMFCACMVAAMSLDALQQLHPPTSKDSTENTGSVENIQNPLGVVLDLLIEGRRLRILTDVNSELLSVQTKLTLRCVARSCVEHYGLSVAPCGVGRTTSSRVNNITSEKVVVVGWCLSICLCLVPQQKPAGKTVLDEVNSRLCAFRSDLDQQYINFFSCYEDRFDAKCRGGAKHEGSTQAAGISVEDQLLLSSTVQCMSADVLEILCVMGPLYPWLCHIVPILDQLQLLVEELTIDSDTLQCAQKFFDCFLQQNAEIEELLCRRFLATVFFDGRKYILIEYEARQRETIEADAWKAVPSAPKEVTARSLEADEASGREEIDQLSCVERFRTFPFEAHLNALRNSDLRRYWLMKQMDYFLSSQLLTLPILEYEEKIERRMHVVEESESSLRITQSRSREIWVDQAFHTFWSRQQTLSSRRESPVKLSSESPHIEVKITAIDGEITDNSNDIDEQHQLDSFQRMEPHPCASDEQGVLQAFPSTGATPSLEKMYFSYLHLHTVYGDSLLRRSDERRVFYFPKICHVQQREWSARMLVFCEESAERLFVEIHCVFNVFRLEAEHEIHKTVAAEALFRPLLFGSSIFPLPQSLRRRNLFSTQRSTKPKDADPFPLISSSFPPPRTFQVPRPTVPLSMPVSPTFNSLSSEKFIDLPQTLKTPTSPLALQHRVFLQNNQSPETTSMRSTFDPREQSSTTPRARALRLRPLSACHDAQDDILPFPINFLERQRTDNQSHKE